MLKIGTLKGELVGVGDVVLVKHNMYGKLLIIEVNPPLIRGVPLDNLTLFKLVPASCVVSLSSDNEDLLELTLEEMLTHEYEWIRLAGRTKAKHAPLV